MARIAESFLAHGAEALSSGDRYQAIVHVDAQTLRDGCAGRCEHEDGPALSAETARRLSCDSSLVYIVEDEDGEPLNVGRKTRTIAPPIRRALQSRDRGCRFPGCPNKHYVDGHHIRHWPMAAKHASRTSRCFAAFIIGRFMKAASRSRFSMTARCASR